METHVPNTIIELTVNNHAGVMSHITGLFSRRAFNLEAILCAPMGGGETSRMYLLVNRDERLEQIVRQVEKLADVRGAAVRDDFDHTVFARIEELMTANGKT